MRRDIDLLTLIGFGEQVEVVKAGENLFTEGDFGDCMYLVKSGRIDVKAGQRNRPSFIEITWLSAEATAVALRRD